MTESFIKRIQPDQDGLDFAGLRQEGIRIVQEVSGDVWTDFNLHDPGVTLLEAICYAMTDLLYRADFGAADYLAASDGSIGFRKQALYRPDEILPCHALTDNDYRKLILSSIPNLDNVWLQRISAGEGAPQGLCRIYVQLSDRLPNHDSEGVKKVYLGEIEKVYAANRNLCEDLAEVKIVERTPFYLGGEIEVAGKREAAHVLAEIYFECAHYLSSRVPIHSYAEMYKSGRSMEELFTGILARTGYIAEEELYPWRGNFSIPDLIGIISRIDGVKNINHLFFIDAEGNESDSINLGKENIYLAVACLYFPDRDSESDLKLFKAGKAYPISQRDVEPEFNRLDLKRNALRQRKRRFDWVDGVLPVATFRKISEYYSLQNHLPDVYGLNAYGIPESYPAQRKAQAAQLKAYLLFFEQVMANFLQNVQEIPRLFSLDEQLRQSYFSQILRDDAVPNVEELYVDGLDKLDVKLAELLATFDNYGDRRNRVLDYLLALYGERFSQNSLRHLFPEAIDAEQERIDNKLAFLRDIEDLSKNRAAAFDYRKPVKENQNSSGLKKKLKLFLGLKAKHGAPPLVGGNEPNQGNADFHIVEHILLRPACDVMPSPSDTDEDFFSFRMSIIFPSEVPPFDSKEFRKLAQETLYLNCPAHIYAEIFWLQHTDMDSFNALHESWLKSRRSKTSNAEKLAETTNQLITFLREIRQQING